MNLDYLPFEQDLAKINDQIASLRGSHEGSSATLSKEIKQLEKKREDLTKQIYSQLSIWQTVQVARHPRRPYLLDYIDLIFQDFQELQGDRHFADDPAIVGGLAKLDKQTVMIIGQQKGRSTQEKIHRNFGMPRPEGYRKALRLMQLAAKFQIPILTFIDTPGAFPGIDAEERNQSEAIARNLMVMAKLPTPIIGVVIGEGGSGGALAIGVADRVAMLQYSIYSVISPEGCASILWKDASHAPKAAEAMQVTAQQNSKLGLVDEVLEEPLGGAHNNFAQTAATIKNFFHQQLGMLSKLSTKTLLDQRFAKLMKMGL
jgi:acetyl-CoA carboxylase carboxyl transferase subunit alpha